MQHTVRGWEVHAARVSRTKIGGSDLVSEVGIQPLQIVPTHFRGGKGASDTDENVSLKGHEAYSLLFPEDVITVGT